MTNDNAKDSERRKIQPGRDANANDETKPAPLETDEGEQADDNIDDQGNKSGGGKLEQPT